MTDTLAMDDINDELLPQDETDTKAEEMNTTIAVCISIGVALFMMFSVVLR